jgi:hypothetical protein
LIWSYCLGPTCFRISGIMSLSCFTSGTPVTTSSYSRIENCTKGIARYNFAVVEKCDAIFSIMAEFYLTLWLLDVNDSVIILEHVDFVNFWKWLDT